MPSTNGHGSKLERIGLYMRVSSEEQKEKESIATQEGFLEEYCKLYGLEVAAVYKDEAVSGTVPMRQRPKGALLLADAKAGAFDTVLVYKLDRIGRSLLVVVDAHDRLGEVGVALKSATEPIDTSTAAGRLIFQMLASFSEFERATITERSRDGLRRAFKEGRHLGRIPYGYDVNAEGAFEIVEDEARVVRRIITNVAAGATLYSEAKRLNDEGEPSPGSKYRDRPRKPGACWHPSAIRAIVTATTYSGIHTIRAAGGNIGRKVPALVEPELREKALARLEENKRYSGGKSGRKYLLRGLVACAYCTTACTGDVSVSSMGYRYHYYSCRKKRTTQYDARRANHGYSCPKVKAQWLEELVWADVRTFLEDPGEALERVRVQLSDDREGDNLKERHASLTARLTAKQEAKARYVKLYAQGHVDEEELEVYIADLKNQVENLKLLISSVEADLAQEQENKMMARSTEAWLMALRKNLSEVEQDAEEAFETRRELVKLLVERIVLSRNEEGRPKVEITYRFGSPAGLESATGSQNSEEFKKAHGRSGGGDLLRGHPQMSAYEIAVEREPEASEDTY